MGWFSSVYISYFGGNGVTYMKRAIVTGALGFIGFHLCNRLLSEGIEVIGIDSSTDKRLTEEKLYYFGRNALFKWINKSLEKVDLTTLTKEVDVLYHLAGATAAENDWSTMANSINNNVRLTKKLAMECTETTKVIYSSTLQVYGYRIGEITEKTPLNPITPYGLTKLAGEAILKEEGKKRGLRLSILRLPTVYGPWQREDMIYHQLLRKKLKGEKMKITKTDVCTTDILYVEDVVEALYNAGIKKIDTEIINLASGKERQWFKGIEIITGEKDKGWENPRLKVFVSNKRANEVLDFTPSFTLTEGIKQQEILLKKYLHIY